MLLMVEIPSEINVSHVMRYSVIQLTNTYMFLCVIDNRKCKNSTACGIKKKADVI